MACSAFLVFSSLPAVAQYILRGVVTNEKGEPVRGALLTLSSGSVGGLYRHTTDHNGSYKFVPNPGIYRLEVRAQGYQPAVADDLVLGEAGYTGNGIVLRNFVLTPVTAPAVELPKTARPGEKVYLGPSRTLSKDKLGHLRMFFFFPGRPIRIMGTPPSGETVPRVIPINWVDYYIPTGSYSIEIELDRTEHSEAERVDRGVQDVFVPTRVFLTPTWKVSETPHRNAILRFEVRSGRRYRLNRVAKDIRRQTEAGERVVPYKVCIDEEVQKKPPNSAHQQWCDEVDFTVIAERSER